MSAPIASRCSDPHRERLRVRWARELAALPTNLASEDYFAPGMVRPTQRFGLRPAEARALGLDLRRGVADATDKALGLELRLYFEAGYLADALAGWSWQEVLAALARVAHGEDLAQLVQSLRTMGFTTRSCASPSPTHLDVAPPRRDLSSPHLAHAPPRFAPLLVDEVPVA